MKRMNVIPKEKKKGHEGHMEVGFLHSVFDKKGKQKVTRIELSERCLLEVFRVAHGPSGRTAEPSGYSVP
jgi:hypothetical protein